ncbi:hypothetical protein BDZ89DRAFT_1137881 [Hymenopellis radicata]|nr:hypothetical protein BDZ89DRAFT_1137881 [Hymenopellis radicata]
MSQPLEKGSACLNCRRRKVRCDAVKPQCGPCRASRAYQDCEFTNSGPTRTQQLKEQIAKLESRIKEIEGPVASSSQSSGLNDNKINQLGTVPNHRQLPQVIPPPVRSAIMQRFLKYASANWFFLNVDRFSAAFLDPNSEALITVLTNTVILWGIHLSSSTPLSHHEGLYLTRAVQDASHGLVQPYVHNIVQLIQAEVLLAQYFFKNARMVEGRYHTGLALSIVFGAGFHKIGSTQASNCTERAINVAPSKDLVEEGERIGAFWTVVALNNCWTTRESNVSYDDIDTPWPLEMQRYSLNLVPANSLSGRTVSNWLRGQQDPGSDSLLAQHAKASVLYEQAVQNGLQRRGNPTQFLNNYNRLESSISQFSPTLISLHELPQTVHPGRAVLVHVLLYSAMVQLYLPVIDININAAGSILTSIGLICRTLRAVNVTGLSDIDPFLSSLLATACRFLISYISMQSQAAEASEMLKLIVAVMTYMANHSRHAETQILEIQQLLT